jgi:excinuclease UvrABC ATPase subunit
VLHRLVETGTTVMMSKHNLKAIKTLGWIDLGSESGDGTARSRRVRQRMW